MGRHPAVDAALFLCVFGGRWVGCAYLGRWEPVPGPVGGHSGPPGWEPERAERVREALERVGLTKRAKHLPTELSGGQQQRVAIARAIATRPKLILADEPTGALDSKTGQEIIDIFHELHAQGNTIVLITHDPNVAKQAARSIHILDGRISEVKL